MSDSTSLKLGGDERSLEDLGQKPDVNVGPSCDADMASDASEEGELKDDPPTDGMRKHSPSGEGEEQRPMKMGKPALELGAGSFKQMKHPSQRMRCIVSVKGCKPVGTLYRTKDEFTMVLFIDPGRYGPPAITLEFRNSGDEGSKDSARVFWDMLSNDRGQLAMSHVVHGHATSDATDARMSNPDALTLCREQDKTNLLYMGFQSWGQGKGFRVRDAFKGRSPGIKRLLNTVFQPDGPYQVELWFIPPFRADDFRKSCLIFFSDCLEQRVHPFHQWQDRNGDYFNDKLLLPPPSILVNHMNKKNGPRQSIATPKKDVSMGSEVTAQVEKSTAESPLAVQHLEHSTSTLARDVKKPDRSPSPPGQAQHTGASNILSEAPASAAGIFANLGAGIVPSCLLFYSDSDSDNSGSGSKAGPERDENGDVQDEED